MKYKEKVDWSVYAIIDQDYIGERSIEIVTEQMIAGGADVIQYRNKTQLSRAFYDNAYLIRKITTKHEIPFIVNDRIDIALAVKADGVHLGQTDLPFDIARELVGEKMLIGASISNLSEFENTSDADYFGVGAIFPTDTKEDATKKV